MKKLVDFLQEHKNDNKPHRIIAAPSEKQSSEYTFEEFCNDVDNYSDYKIEELWEAYQCTKFIPGSYQYLGLSYEEWLYETEMLVASSQKVFEYIEENFLDWFESYDDIDNKYTDFVYYKFYGKLDKLNNIIDNDKFIKFMNWANWAAYLTKDKNGDYILVKPNKTEVMTDKVYSYDFVYHYCPKFIYNDKISKYGLNPKNKFGNKYEKIYCFWSKNPVEDMQQWARIKLRTTDNIYKKEKIEKDNFVVLKIDLKKCKEKIRFYKDEESNSPHTFYTFEPIAPFAIVDVLEMNVKL